MEKCSWKPTLTSVHTVLLTRIFLYKGIFAFLFTETKKFQIFMKEFHEALKIINIL